MKKYTDVAITSLVAVGSVGFWAWTNGRLMPQIAHTADDIAAAHRLFQIVPPLSIALLVVGALLTARSWRRHSGRLFRAASMLPVVVLLIGVVLVRGTFVELMFSPVDEARFVTVADAGFLEPEHLVLGVSIAGEAKAYPVAMMTYHHIVNDRLAGEPYVATY
jgi:hypothetical protein